MSFNPKDAAFYSTPVYLGLVYSSINSIEHELNTIYYQQIELSKSLSHSVSVSCGPSKMFVSPHSVGDLLYLLHNVIFYVYKYFSHCYFLQFLWLFF